MQVALRWIDARSRRGFRPNCASQSARYSATGPRWLQQIPAPRGLLFKPRHHYRSALKNCFNDSLSGSKTRTSRCFRSSTSGAACGSCCEARQWQRVSLATDAAASVCAAACAAKSVANCPANAMRKRKCGTRCEYRRRLSHRATVRLMRGCAWRGDAARAPNGGARDAPLSTRRG